MKTAIGLIGVKTSGKSTVGAMIKDLVPNAKEVALADKLKDMSAQAFGLKREQFDLQNLKEVPFSDGPKFMGIMEIKNILAGFNVSLDEHRLYKATADLEEIKLETPRKIAQIVGTELLRKYASESVHCDSLDLSSDVSIVTDVRFENEFEYLNTTKRVDRFVPLYLHRQEAEKVVNLATDHASETSVFKFNHKCFLVNNNGNLEQTFEQVKNILDHALIK